jgi:hypothetical protein
MRIFGIFCLIYLINIFIVEACPKLCDSILSASIRIKREKNTVILSDVPITFDEYLHFSIVDSHTENTTSVRTNIVYYKEL